MTAATCPDCRRPLPVVPPRCPGCGIGLTGALAVRLGRLDRELAGLTERRTQLLRERVPLLAELRRQSPAAVAPVRHRPPTQPPIAPESSPVTVQNVLLGLGGLLLGAAAITFVVITWSVVGLAGRGTILAALTALLLTAPPLLHRRGLTATAETLGQLALLLCLVDGWAAWHVGLVAHVGLESGTGWAAVTCCATATVAGTLHRLVGLRLPLTAALLLSQPVPALVALAGRAPAAGWLLAGAVVAAVDTGAICWLSRRGSYRVERGIAAGFATGSLAVTLLTSLVTINGPTSLAAGLVGSAVLVMLGLLARAERLRNSAIGTAILAGSGQVVACCGLGYDGLAPGLVAVGAGALALLLPRRVQRGPLIAALAVGGLLLSSLLVDLAQYGRHLQLSSRSPWQGSGRLSTAWVDLPLAHVGAAVGVRLAVHGWSTVRPLFTLPRNGIRRAGIALGGLVTAGLALELTRSALTVLVVHGVLTLVATLAALAPGLRAAERAVAATSALLLLGAAVLASLATATATLMTLGAALVLLVGVAEARRGPVSVAAAGSAGVAITGLTGAVAAAAGASPAPIAWLLVGAAAGVSVVATVLRRRDGWADAGRLLALSTTLTGPVAALVGGHSLVGAASLLAASGAAAGFSALLTKQRLDRRGHATYAGLLASVALLLVLPPVLTALLAPTAWITRAWQGAPGGAGAGLAPGFAWTGSALVVLVLALVTLTAGLAARSLGAARAPLSVTVLGTATTVLVLPVALDLSRLVATLVAGGVCLVATAAIVRPGRRLPYAVPVAVSTSGGALALAWALDASSSTVSVLVLLVALGGVVSWLAAPSVRLVAPSVTLPLLGTLAVVSCLAYGLGLAAAGLTALAVCGALVVAAGLLGTGPTIARLEVVGIATVVGAVILTTADRPMLAIALLVLGALTAGAGMPTRRRPLNLVGAGIAVPGGWLVLMDAHVQVAEAYTLPAAAVLLATGAVLRRRRPALSSWTTYGPGLGLLLAPSALVVLVDAGPSVRPTLLALGALVVVAVGARGRQQAPLLLGAAALVVAVGSAVGPAAWQVMLGLPRWIPLALAGAALVAAGATYEARRRDVRQLVRLIGRLH